MNIFWEEVKWHYLYAPRKILGAWRNFIWFNFNYFSLLTLVKTYLSPWRRYYSPYGKVFEFWKNFEALIFNAMSRILGAVVRTFLIFFGLLSGLAIIVGGAIIFIGWLVLPIILIIVFLFGLNLVI